MSPAAPGKINPTLDRMARFINLLGADGVHLAAGDLVAIVHGPATALVMDDASYRAKFGVANPNLELIEHLRQNGAEVRVCSQALAGVPGRTSRVAPSGRVSVIVRDDSIVGDIWKIVRASRATRSSSHHT